MSAPGCRIVRWVRGGVTYGVVEPMCAPAEVDKFAMFAWACAPDYCWGPGPGSPSPCCPCGRAPGYWGVERLRLSNQTSAFQVAAIESTIRVSVGPPPTSEEPAAGTLLATFQLPPDWLTSERS